MRRRYFEWDYVANRVIEWVRVGTCCRCGACCRGSIGYNFENVKTYHANKAGGYYTTGRGVWQEIRAGRYRHFFRMEYMAVKGRGWCGSFENGLCAEYEHRSWICREWPFSPRCIAPFAECTYGFREVDRWPFVVDVPKDPAKEGKDAGGFVHVPRRGVP